MVSRGRTAFSGERSEFNPRRGKDFWGDNKMGRFKIKWIKSPFSIRLLSPVIAIYVIKENNMIYAKVHFHQKIGAWGQAYPETFLPTGHCPTINGQIWYQVTKPASLFSVDWTRGGYWTQGRLHHWLAGDQWPGAKWWVGIIGSLKKTEIGDEPLCQMLRSYLR